MRWWPLLLLFNFSLWGQDITPYTKYTSLQDPMAKYNLLSEIIYGQESISSDTIQLIASLLKEEFASSKNPKYLSLQYLLLANDRFYQNDREGCLELYLNVAQVFDDVPNDQKDYTLIASGYGNYASVLNELGKKAQCIEVLKSNFIIAQLTGDLREVADWNYNIATAYTDMNVFDSAAHYFQECYEVDLQLENTYGIFHDLRFIAENLRRSEKYEEALATLQRANTWISDQKYLREATMIYSATGQIYQQLKNQDSSLFYVNKAILLAESTKDYSRRNRMQLQLAEAYIEFEQLEKAKPIVRKLQQLKTGEDNASVVLGAHVACLRIDLADKNQPHAKNCLERSFGIAENYDNKAALKEIYPLAQEYYKRNKQFDKALEMSQKEIELVKALNHEDLQRNLMQQQFQYDLSQVEKEKEVIALQQEITSNQLKSSRTWLWIIGGSLLALGIIGLQQFRNQKNKQALIAQEKDAEILKASNLLIEKEMEALRAQMNPHFLFNSLNSINNSIINNNPRKASKYLTKFAKLVRHILTNSKSRYVTLENEIETLQLYTTMGKERFEGKFEVAWEIQEDIAMNQILIPPMLIQPYIENAIKHGLRPKDQGGILTIEIKQNGEQIILEVDDNGVGRSATISNNSKHQSYGMSITQDRLGLIEQVYGIKAHVDIIDKASDKGSPLGTRIIVTIPVIGKEEV